MHTIDIPPVKSKVSAEKYERQLALCAELLATHLGKRLTRRNLRNAAVLTAQAHAEARRFLRLTEKKPELVSTPWQMLIVFSYYCTDHISQWMEQLARLNDRIEASRLYNPCQPDSHVLLMGSPVCFPNYKIPLCCMISR